MGRIRVVLIDDHAVVRVGVRCLINEQPDMEVVGEAGDGVEAIERCSRLKPDVAVLDLSMPGLGGIATAKELNRMRLGVKLLAFTIHEDEGYLRLFLNAGGNGYVLKKQAAATLVQALRAVCSGKTYVPPSLEKAMSRKKPPSIPSRFCADRPDRALTEREKEVLCLIALGYGNQESAARLHVSEKTIEAHRAHILEKLHLKTRADLVRYALECRCDCFETGMGSAI